MGSSTRCEMFILHQFYSQLASSLDELVQHILGHFCFNISYISQLTREECLMSGDILGPDSI